jgi:hypothetical protein
VIVTQIDVFRGSVVCLIRDTDGGGGSTWPTTSPLPDVASPAASHPTPATQATLRREPEPPGTAMDRQPGAATPETITTPDPVAVCPTAAHRRVGAHDIPERPLTFRGISSGDVCSRPPDVNTETSRPSPPFPESVPTTSHLTVDEQETADGCRSEPTGTVVQVLPPSDVLARRVGTSGLRPVPALTHTSTDTQESAVALTNFRRLVRFHRFPASTVRRRTAPLAVVPVTMQTLAAGQAMVVIVRNRTGVASVLQRRPPSVVTMMSPPESAGLPMT